MADQIQAFFDRLAARGYEPLLHSISGTVQWNIEGKGCWIIVIKQGAVSIIPGATAPDSIMECSEDDFIRMLQGEQNPITAFLH